MKEIGGYIELDRYNGIMLHDSAVALNCGRNCLAYIIKSKKIKTILLPFFICGSVVDLCQRENVKINFYSIDVDFLPKSINLEPNEWLYIVNYYGQIDNEQLKQLSKEYGNIIVDNAQAYYQMPIEGVDTLYTCRKYFGVSDGAFLYTDSLLSEELSKDESFERMHFLLGRFERTASEFYNEYASNNQIFADEPIKSMSKLTDNLLHGIDYDFVKKRRTDNFTYLHSKLSNINKLKLNIPEGAFMYPLYTENGAQIRKILQQEKIYIPVLWPDVFNTCSEDMLEYNMAENILPLPVDQRYDKEDMNIIVQQIRASMGMDC